jgi:hypothetical protein
MLITTSRENVRGDGQRERLDFTSLRKAVGFYLS